MIGYAWGDQEVREAEREADREVREHRAMAAGLVAEGGGAVLADRSRGRDVRWDVRLHRGAIPALSAHLASSPLVDGELVYDSLIASDYPTGLVTTRPAPAAAELFEAARQDASARFRAALLSVVVHCALGLGAWLALESLYARSVRRADARRESA